MTLAQILVRQPWNAQQRVFVAIGSLPLVIDASYVTVCSSARTESAAAAGSLSPGVPQPCMWIPVHEVTLHGQKHMAASTCQRQPVLPLDRVSSAQCRHPYIKCHAPQALHNSRHYSLSCGSNIGSSCILSSSSSCWHSLKSSKPGYRHSHSGTTFLRMLSNAVESMSTGGGRLTRSTGLASSSTGSSGSSSSSGSTGTGSNWGSSNSGGNQTDAGSLSNSQGAHIQTAHAGSNTHLGASHSSTGIVGYKSRSVPGLGSSILVQACAQECSCQERKPWCKFPVRIPHADWSKVFDSNSASYPAFLMRKGLERVDMPEGIRVYLVSSPDQAAPALQLLRDSMLDSVVAIDLEWQPDGLYGGQKQQLAQQGPAKVAAAAAAAAAPQVALQQQQAEQAGAGIMQAEGVQQQQAPAAAALGQQQQQLGYAASAATSAAEEQEEEQQALQQQQQGAPAAARTPVAVVQLASSSVCVLLHVSSMGFSLPPGVKDFLTDPAITLVGFSWNTADEAKLQRSFGFGAAAFAGFIDLQQMAGQLGYKRPGLANVTKQVMGISMGKIRQVQTSNWAAPRLTMQQIKYASLDVLAAGQVFRSLRLWHCSSSPLFLPRQPTLHR